VESQPSKEKHWFSPDHMPGRKPLVTLRDAAQHIIELSKAEHELPQWEIAIEWVMLDGEHGGDPMVPRIGMMKALLLHKPKRHRAGNAPKPTSPRRNKSP
jgi:hypothetical protein